MARGQSRAVPVCSRQGNRAVTLAYVPPALNGVPIAPHDRVRVPDGSVGEVIGFYRGDVETVVVRLGNGNSRQFVPADLRPPN
jgi:hypothetical protein